MENKKLTHSLGELFQLISQFDELNVSLVSKETLTPSELHLVECIGQKEKTTSKDIGEALNITKGAVSQQLKKLIESHAVIKVPSKEDGRVSYLELTKKGEAFYKEHEKTKISFESSLNQNLSNQEMSGFLKGIQLLNGSLQEKMNRGERNEK